MIKAIPISICRQTRITRGYACTAAAQLILDSLFIEKGVFPGELVGKHSRCFDSMLQYMAQRGIDYRKEERTDEA